MPGIPQGCQCQRCLYPLSLLRHATEGKSKLSPGVGLSSSTQNCLSLLLLLLALLLSFFSPAARCLWVIFTLQPVRRTGVFCFFFFFFSSKAHMEAVLGGLGLLYSADYKRSLL